MRSLLISLFGLCMFVLLVSQASAVTVEGANYKIVCSPDDAPITSVGYMQFCDYTWFGTNNITRDVAFCFDKQVLRGGIDFWNNGQWLDISNQFKYKSMQMVKGDCYYIQNVKWVPNETKSIRLRYFADSLNPKWDTYFGNLTANRIDLILDPTYNVTRYEVGTSRSDAYFWTSTSFPFILSSDLVSNNATNPYINATFLTNTNSFYINGFYGMNYTNDVRSNLNAAFDNNASSYAILGDFDMAPASGFIVGKIFNLTNVSTITLANGGGWSGASCPTFSSYWVSVMTYNGSVWSEEYNTSQCSFPYNYSVNKSVQGVGLKGFVGAGGAGWQLRVVGMSWSGKPETVKNVSNITSVQVNLTSFVSQYKINASITGSAFVNISFDGGVSSQYVNLTNGSWITPVSSVSGNNKLLYRLDLLNNQTTIYNFSLDFNMSNVLVNVSTYKKWTLQRTNYTLNFSGPTSLVSNTDNLTQSSTVNSAYYNVSINKSGFYGCNYVSVALNQSQALSNCTLYDLHNYILFMDHLGNLVPASGVVSAGLVSESFNASNGIFELNGTGVLTNFTFNVGSGNQSYSYTPSTDGVNVTIYVFNSLSIRIYDEENLTLVNSMNVSVDFSNVDLGLGYNYSTGNGTLTVGNVTNGLYYIYFSTPSYYTTRVYTYNMSSFGSSLNVYLSAGSVTTFTFYNIYGAIVPNVHIIMQSIINNSWVTVEDKYSDIQGQAQFLYSPFTNYRFNYSKSGYQSNYFLLSPITSSTYSITLPFSSVSPSYGLVNVSGVASYNNVSHVLTFQYTSYNASYLNYSYVVLKVSNASTLTICNESSAALSDSFTCDLTGRSGVFTVRGFADNQSFYGQSLDIAGLPTLFDNLDPRDAAFYAALILLVILLGGVSFGVVGALVSGVSGVLALYWLHILNPITGTLVVVDVIVTIVIILGMRRS